MSKLFARRESQEAVSRLSPNTGSGSEQLATKAKTPTEADGLEKTGTTGDTTDLVKSATSNKEALRFAQQKENKAKESEKSGHGVGTAIAVLGGAVAVPEVAMLAQNEKNKKSEKKADAKDKSS